MSDQAKSVDTAKTREGFTHLRRLESESIHIMREVAAEAENPVMLYSVGKDSAVMLHLAMKAFHPSKPPFPIMHVDTTWKFGEMITFRDKMAEKLGLELLVHTNEEALKISAEYAVRKTRDPKVTLWQWPAHNACDT